MVILLFILALGAKGPHFCSFKVNHMDITVNFNGVIMGVVNSAGAIGGLAGPYTVAKVAPDNTLEQWILVFWIALILNIVPMTIYVVMSRATRSQWDVPEDELEEFLRQKEAEAARKARIKEEKRRRKEENARRRREPTGSTGRTGRTE